MRLLIQRVLQAEVRTDEQLIASIGKGLLVFAGVEQEDGEDDVNWLTKKVLQLRIFEDDDRVPNLSVMDISGDLLVVSQFTLQARVKKGNRPSYIRAARPDTAIRLYEQLAEQLSAGLGKPVPTGLFGADMQVSLINDGPVTIWIDSKNRE